MSFQNRAVRVLLCLSPTIPLTAGANDLVDLYHTAQAQDMVLQAALHQREAAVEAHPQALAALLPQIAGTAGIDRDRAHQLSQNSFFGASVGVDYYKQTSYGLNLSQTVFDWSSFQTLAKANRLAAQAQATYSAAEQDLIYRVADTYFNVLFAQDTLQADTDAQTAYQQQLDLAQKKYEVGFAAITDIRNAQAAFDTSTAVVIADRRALDSARRSLGQLVGRSIDTIAGLRDDIPLQPPDPVNADDWARAAMQDNPTLLAYRSAAEAARADIGNYRGKYLPTLSIVGRAQRQNSDYQFSGDAIDDSIGLQLNWSLFQGGAIASQVRQAVATHEQAQSQYEGQRRIVEQNARDAFEGVISGIASVNANHQAVISNQTSLDATQTGLKVGTRTVVDVVTARQALAAAQHSYYQSRYDYLRSVLALRQQVGRLTELDLQSMDDLLLHR
jgi:outer membrane protein